MSSPVGRHTRYEDETPAMNTTSNVVIVPEPVMPRTIKIGVVTYTVIVDEDGWVNIEHETQTKGYYGHTKNATSEIFINPKSSTDVARRTLWHEVMHALCETAMGSPDWTNLGDEKDDREELIIRRLEHPTLQVLRDNPGLVAYLAD